jgi:N-sulfoglucosamine sulfohydrolase
MKIRLLLLPALLVSSVFAVQAAEVTPPARKPNILFAIADDWGFGHAGAYGSQWVKTPAFDRVARDGILFANAYTPCGKCSPSRASILTGRNPWQLKEGGNHHSIFPPEFKSFPEAMGELGYFTGATGKGWGPGISNDAAGNPRDMAGPFFNEFKTTPPAKGINGCDYAKNFTAFLNAAPKDKPWSFWYGGKEPHRNYEYGSGVAKGGKKLSDIDHVPACWPDTAEVRNDMLDYAFEVEYFDRHLGLMLAELEKRGLLDNTLVIVTSDNGMPFPHAKGYAYEATDHLPLAIMWKHSIAQPGRVVDDYVSFVDFAPTLLEVAGINWKQTGMAPLTGRSLTEIFNSPKSGRIIAERDHVLVGKERTDIGRENDAGYPIRGIVKDGLLYLHNFEIDRWPGGNPETGYMDTDSSPTKSAVLATENNPEQKKYFELCFGKLPADQLFDVKKDPDCVKNLAPAGGFEALKTQLFNELKLQDDPRMNGNGAIFDSYPFSDPTKRNFFERVKNGEKIQFRE